MSQTPQFPVSPLVCINISAAYNYIRHIIHSHSTG